jgi:spoIIIJ-associated protein
MKEFEGKTLEEALENASKELNIPTDQIKYEVVEESKSLFKKHCKISILEISDANTYAVNYLEKILASLNLKAEMSTKIVDDILHIDMVSDDDAGRIIGKNGDTLKALNELVRTALFNRFNQHISVLLNINNYKDHKYDKLESLAKRVANSVRRTKMTAELDPMPSDERRIIHNILSEEPNIKTISVGTGRLRHITIQYVEDNSSTSEENQTNE